MKYISTRGQISPLSFKATVMMGLADDGGLLLPAEIPSVTEKLPEWRGLSYQDLAFNIISLYADDIPAADLRELIDRSYATFTDPEITPVVRKDGVSILELFHGPTLAFKDVALQFLGNLFEYLLKESGRKMNIIGATSGDTGSAAIHGVRGKDNISIFILHPHMKTSPVQARQMTTVLDENVHNIAVKGTFDDCQNIVKGLFADLEFKEKYSLGAVNSINWARVLAQVVYYFYAWFRVTERNDQQVVFSVPTGNFGDIFAGYVAKRMGLPIERLLLATNENNILTRFVNDGDYSLSDVVPTLSPSMDIQVASNFERYLFYLFDQNAEKVRETFREFAATGKMVFTEGQREQVKRDFISCSVNRVETIETIREFKERYDYVLDPHTAVGVRAALELKPEAPVVCLATAHPAKFEEAVREATGADPVRPASLDGIDDLPTRFQIAEAEREAIRSIVEATAA